MMQVLSWHGELVVQYAQSLDHMGCSGASIPAFQAKRAPHAKHSQLRSGEQVLWVPKHFAMHVESAG